MRLLFLYVYILFVTVARSPQEKPQKLWTGACKTFL